MFRWTENLLVEVDAAGAAAAGGAAAVGLLLNMVDADDVDRLRGFPVDEELLLLLRRRELLFDDDVLPFIDDVDEDGL